MKNSKSITELRAFRQRDSEYERVMLDLVAALEQSLGEDVRGYRWEYCLGLTVMRVVDTCLFIEESISPVALEEIGKGASAFLQGGQGPGPMTASESYEATARIGEKATFEEFVSSDLSKPNPPRWHNLLWNLAQTISVMWSRKSGIAVVEPYMGYWQTLKFAFFLKARIFASCKVKASTEAAADLRSRLYSSISTSGSTDFDKYVRALVCAVIPLDLVASDTSISTPRTIEGFRPSAVVTSIGLSSCDRLRLFLTRTDKIPELFVLQHGSNYGTLKWGQSTTLDMKLADHFVSWGESKNGSIAGVLFRGQGTLRASFPRTLRIGLVLPRQEKSWMFFDTCVPYLEWMSENWVFLENLPTLTNVIARVMGPQSVLERSLFSSFSKRFHSAAWNSSGNFRRFRLSRHLVVFGYESTGMLECIASNHPFIAFWPEGLRYIRDEYHDVYVGLIQAGILHLSGLAAAKKVASFQNLEDLNTWWNSAQVQDAVTKASLILARRSRAPERELVNLIRNHMGHSGPC